MESLGERARAGDPALKSAPHFAPRRRVDETRARASRAWCGRPRPTEAVCTAYEKAPQDDGLAGLFRFQPKLTCGSRPTRPGRPTGYPCLRP
jgi:hypothetical protein